MKSLWKDGDRQREVELTPLGSGRFRVRVDDATFELEVEAVVDGRMRLVSETGGTTAEVTADGARRYVRLGSLEFVLEREAAVRRRGGAAAHASLAAPMPGVVTKVLVKPGDEVGRGDPLVAIEAMKMEHLIRAPRDGKVKSIPVAQGQMVQGGTVLAELED